MPSTAANDLQTSASFSARKNPQRIPANTPPVFSSLRPRICQHLLSLGNEGLLGQTPGRLLNLSERQSISYVLLWVSTGSGIP